MKTYILDTSTLIADPDMMHNVEDTKIIIPATVLSELEKLRSDSQIGFFARKALHHLEDLRVKNTSLDRDVKINETSTLKIELNNISEQVLPAGFRLGDNDSIILAVAKSFSAKNDEKVTVVSQDLPMRLKAAAIGLEAMSWSEEGNIDDYTGVTEGWVSPRALDDLYNKGEIDSEEIYEGPAEQRGALEENVGVELHSWSGSSGLGYYHAGKIRKINNGVPASSINPHSKEQSLALHHLMNEDVGVVSLGGKAGTGKTALALAAGVELTLEKRVHRKITVFRSLYPVGGQELGYLPGSHDEKMAPWAQAVWDALETVASKNVIEDMVSRGMVEVLPITHIRGRSLHDAFVIVDEAQALEKNVLLTVLSRIGKNSKIALTHDTDQRDNLKVGKFDGIWAVAQRLRGHELFAHVTLKRSERSAIADLATRML